MLSPDESQQSAELRQVFVKTLPKRLETVHRRARRLTMQGWDVNVLTVFFQDVQALAGACGRYGVLDAGEVLFGIETFVAPYLEQVSLPDDEARPQFQHAIDALGALIAKHVPEKVAATGPGVMPLVVERGGIQTLVVPPREYWRRWGVGDVDIALANATTAPMAPAAAPAAAPATASAAPVPAARAQPKPIRATAEKRIYHLTAGDPLSSEIDQKLEGSRYPFDLIEDADTLREMLGAFAPAMVVVDAAFLPQLDAIGDSLRLARTRTSQKVALVVFADNNDIATRLKAMRAGADAFITLPTGAADALARIEELLEGEGGEPFRVLIIEDDRSQALFAESILRKAGMETRAVMDPISALEELNAFRPELILMDLYMPDCDGMELTTLIREREAYTNVPIVFLSGEHDEEKRFDALSAGGDDYLEKPIRPKHLISAVTNRVRRARATQKRVLAHNPRDPVSGLYDRAHVLERVGELLANDEAHRQGGGLLFLLVDGAQNIRERIGLSAFDQLMGQAGAFLTGLVQARDIGARFGDTSFIVLAPESQEAELLELGGRIRQAFDQHVFEIGDRSITLAVAIGVATFGQNLGETAAMVNAAERACVAARQDPERRVALFQTQITHTGDADEDMLFGAIRDAIRNESFQLLFQPIASLRGGHDEQFQTLLRLRGDGGRTYTAAVLVPLAERAGLIHGVDRWVLSRALLVISERARDGHPVRLFVSQSIESLNDPQRLAWLKQGIETRRISPEHLVVEFRTADALARIRQLAAFHENAKRLGIRLCLSNFDATMANFQLLQHVQVDYVKVAAKYTTAEGQSAKMRAELRQAITHLRERGIRIVAPQVEDAQVAAGLWSTGVDYIQGNFVQQATQDLDFDFNASAL
ncbi:MAG TPA: EAL domain-containing protein [Pseudomonadota bacterium]|jgi:diguanylate cyclase (GGDEF)-like protein|nr:EAL domain-containing protein [Pseudomonadota bacterium]